MTKVAAITTMGEKYYNVSGQWAIKTFEKYWNNVNLHIYTEDEESLSFLKTKKRFVHPLTDLDSEYFEFQKKNYKNRVKVFSIKAFVLLHAIKKIDCDYLVWHDGDLITKRSVTPEFFADICKDNLIVYNGIDYLWNKNDGKGERIFHSCDSGFFILNLNHSQIDNFYNLYKDYYVNEKTENLKRFYDNDVLGNVIVDLEKQGTKTLDLNSADRNRFSPLNLKSNLLQPFFTHFKGGRKEFKNIEQLTKPFL